MPRKARKYIDYRETIYHVVCRGNNQKKIFSGVRDYKKLLSIIRETKKKMPFWFYSYSFLPNHFHLLIETRDFSLSKIVGRINFLYAVYFNHRHHRSGHLFQDRFYSSVINKEDYFWTVSCYIDLNPVRAKIVILPENYRWGSFKIYKEKIIEDDLIDRNKFLSYIGRKDPEECRQEYLNFVQGEIISDDKKIVTFLN